MNRNYKFVPFKLIQAKRDYGIENRSVNEKPFININTKEFEIFLRKLVSLTIDEVPFFVMQYDVIYFRSLSRYIVSPKIEVPLENCFRALELKFRKDYLDLAYLEYQQTLGNSEFVEWFKKMATLHPEYKIMNRISITVLNKYIRYPDSAILFVLYARENTKSIEMVAEEFAIRKNTQLFLSMDSEWLISATKTEYLKMNQEALLNKFDGYTMKDQGRLFDNYVTQVSVKDSNIRFLKNIYQKYRTPEEVNVQFWRYVSQDVAENYLQWLNIENINQILGNDNRSRYWKRYAKYLKATYIQESKGQIALDFGAFVVVEFTNIGAAYFYSKENFDKYFKKYFRKNNSTGDSNLKDTRIMIDKLSHTGNWSYRFDDFMSNLGVRINARYR